MIIWHEAKASEDTLYEIPYYRISMKVKDLNGKIDLITKEVPRFGQINEVLTFYYSQGFQLMEIYIAFMKKYSRES